MPCRYRPPRKPRTPEKGPSEVPFFDAAVEASVKGCGEEVQTHRPTEHVPPTPETVTAKGHTADWPQAHDELAAQRGLACLHAALEQQKSTVVDAHPFEVAATMAMFACAY